jgi:hypothetical protein
MKLKDPATIIKDLLAKDFSILQNPNPNLLTLQRIIGDGMQYRISVFLDTGKVFVAYGSVDAETLRAQEYDFENDNDLEWFIHKRLQGVFAELVEADSNQL